MWRELDSLLESLVDEGSDQLEAAVLRHLLQGPGATWSDVRRAVERPARLDWRRWSGAAASKEEGAAEETARARVRQALAHWIRIGVVRYAFRSVMRLAEPCEYSVDRAALLRTLGFPELYGYVARLYSRAGVGEAANRSAAAAQRPRSKRPARDTSERDSGGREGALVCMCLSPSATASLGEVVEALSTLGVVAASSQQCIADMLALGVLQATDGESSAMRPMIETAARQIHSLRKTQLHSGATGSIGPRSTLAVIERRVQEIAVGRQDAEPGEETQRDTNAHTTSAVVTDRPTRLAKRRLVKASVKPSARGDNASAPKMNGRPPDDAPMMPERRAAGNGVAAHRLLSLNRRFLEDCLRHLRMAEYAATQLCDLTASPPLADRLAADGALTRAQTNAVMNALLHLTRVAKHTATSRKPEPDGSGTERGFTAGQVWATLTHTFCAPPAAAVRSISLELVEAVLEEYADRRLGLVQCTVYPHSRRYEACETRLLEQTRIAHVEALLVTAGDPHWRRVWRMVLECGPVPTKWCEDHALLPARTVRAYLLHLLGDGWVMAGDARANVGAVPHRPELRSAVSTATGKREQATVRPRRRATRASSAKAAATSRADNDDVMDLEEAHTVPTPSASPLRSTAEDVPCTSDMWFVDLETVYSTCTRICLQSLHNILLQLRDKDRLMRGLQSVLQATNKSGMDPRDLDEGQRLARQVQRQRRHLFESYAQLLQMLLLYWDADC